VLSTKVGRLLRHNPTRAFADGRQHPLPFEAVYGYSYDGIVRSFEDSFQRLGLARIDIIYVHDIGAYQHRVEANAVLMKKPCARAAIARSRSCVPPAKWRRSAAALTNVKCCWRRWNGAPGTFSC
jgi:aryl-alcohol dehydrogenase-like predicted oxidoreductase